MRQVSHGPWGVPQEFVDRLSVDDEAVYDHGDPCAPTGCTTPSGALQGSELWPFGLAQLAMSGVTDQAVSNVTAALKRRGMWTETLLVFCSDSAPRGPWEAGPELPSPST